MNTIQSPFLTIFERIPKNFPADNYEKASNACLYFFRNSLGYKKITFHENQRSEITNVTIHKVKRVVAGFFAFVLFFPVTLFGLAMQRVSRTHSKSYNELKNGNSNVNLLPKPITQTLIQNNSQSTNTIPNPVSNSKGKDKIDPSTAAPISQVVNQNNAQPTTSTSNSKPNTAPEKENPPSQQNSKQPAPQTVVLTNTTAPLPPPQPTLTPSVPNLVVAKPNSTNNLPSPQSSAVISMPAISPQVTNSSASSLPAVNAIVPTPLPVNNAPIVNSAPSISPAVVNPTASLSVPTPVIKLPTTNSQATSNSTNKQQVIYLSDILVWSEQIEFDQREYLKKIERMQNYFSVNKSLNFTAITTFYNVTDFANNKEQNMLINLAVCFIKAALEPEHFAAPFDKIASTKEILSSLCQQICTLPEDIQNIIHEKLSRQLASICQTPEAIQIIFASIEETEELHWINCISTLIIQFLNLDNQANIDRAFIELYGVYAKELNVNQIDWKKCYRKILPEIKTKRNLLSLINALETLKKVHGPVGTIRNIDKDDKHVILMMLIDNQKSGILPLSYDDFREVLIEASLQDNETGYRLQHILRKI